MNPESSPSSLSDDDLRSIVGWAAECAERALPIFEATAPEDFRPREAIQAAHAFARHEVSMVALNRVGWAALTASQEVGDPVASAAAWAAGTVAFSAYTDSMPTQDQINYILNAAAYAAYAIALRTEGRAADLASADDAEVQWAIERASSQVRRLVQELPGRVPSTGRLGTLFDRLDTGLRR